MPNIAPPATAIVPVIALILYAPKQLPDLGRSLGSSIREFKGGITGGDDEPDEKKTVESKSAEKSA